jgi:hypothetical protein
VFIIETYVSCRFGSGYTLMLKVAPPEMNVVSSGPPSPIAAFNSEQGYFDDPNVTPLRDGV